MFKFTHFVRWSFYALIFLFLFHFNTKAQTDINTSFANRLNYIFQPLEKNRVPNGLLLDYAMEFTNLSNFNGLALTDSNYVMASEYWEIYNTLYLSRIHANGFTIQSPSNIDSLWFHQRVYGKIVLSGLFYNYARFRDDAVQNNLITIQNEQTIDRYVAGLWQNPYQTEKLFAISPSLEFYEGKNLEVVLPVNLWQTNASSEVNTIQIDFGDGEGYRAITLGQPLSLNYADTGTKVWTYRLQLLSGQYLYSHSQVKIHNAIVETACPGCRFGTTNPETIPFTADEAFQGLAANGFITIRYRDADLGLRRPLIVVEGFDAGHITSPELQFGTSTINDFFDNVDDGTLNNTALENVITNFPEYDIIYVDWQNGTDFLQRNGLLLQTIIRWVNDNKEPLPGGGIADNVILGLSMGGVISRWALRDMETRLGQQHNTSLYISMDAPQQGANVPAAYQHLARHARSLYVQTGITAGIIETIQFFANGVSPFRALSIADRPASRQMLINWVNGSGNIDNTFHDGWQTELRNLGYPTQDNIRNIAISNGAECGTTQPFAPGAELLNLNGKANTRFLGDIIGTLGFPLAGFFLNQAGFYLGILPGRNDIKYEFITNAQPPHGVSQRIYKGKISYTKKILWLILVSVTITERNNNSNTSLLPIDYYAGGELNIGANINDFNFQNALVRFNMSFSQIPTFSFIPTPSALDIGLNNVTLNNADYLKAYVGGSPPIAPKNTPFDNFTTAWNNQRNNEQHIGFFQRNGDWLAEELTQIGNPLATPPLTNCSAFCAGGVIIGSSNICTSETFYAPLAAGTDYNWIITPSNIATLTPIGNTVQVSRIGSSSGMVTLSVLMNNDDCGEVTLTKTIQIGTASPTDYSICGYDPNDGCRFPRLLFAVNNEYPPGSTYRWYLNNVLITTTNNPTWLYNLDPNECGTFIEVSVIVNTSCGDSAPVGEVVYYACENGFFKFTTSPNPTKGTVKIETTDKTSSINEIQVTDKFGNLKKRITLNMNTKMHNINISDLPADIYIIRIYDGKTWSASKVIKN